MTKEKTIIWSAFLIIIVLYFGYSTSQACAEDDLTDYSVKELLKLVPCAYGWYKKPHKCYDKE